VKALKQPVFDPNWHFHPEYQFFMVLKGSGTRFIGDNVRPFKEGDITFTGPDLPHLWRSDHESPPIEDHSWSEGIVVYFHENILGDSLLKKEEAIKIRQLLKKSIRGLDIKGKAARRTAKMLHKLLYSKGFDSILKLLKILNYLSKTDELEILASPGYTNSLKEGDTERMSMVYAYVMKQFKRKIPASELAELTNMTPSSFSRYFKIHANKTFSEFVSEIRIGHACKLLIEKKMNVSQACYESGFQTLSNFNRQFKAITNRTPLAYKREFLMK
jgi:AraC-like DNA-binding protein